MPPSCRLLRGDISGFFQDKVRQSEGDSGKLWRLLKSLGYSKTASSSHQKIVLEDNGSKIFDPHKVVNIFNNFYTTVASNLVNEEKSYSAEIAEVE